MLHARQDTTLPGTLYLLWTLVSYLTEDITILPHLLLCIICSYSEQWQTSTNSVKFIMTVYFNEGCGLVSKVKFLNSYTHEVGNKTTALITILITSVILHSN
jgi:hypothetical protein